jgi:hypothetical protein
MTYTIKMDDYILYLNKITLQRDKSKSKVKVQVKYNEWVKIWARWIITHNSLYPSSNVLQFLPDRTDVYDHQFIYELLNLDMSREQAEQLYADLEEGKKDILSLCPREIPSIEGFRVEKTEVDNKIRLNYNDRAHYLNKILYVKLVRLAAGSRAKTDEYIWLILTLYQLLDGNSLQWAVPPNVMWVFKEKLHCYTDIFASPLNAYNKNYYSLFYYDRFFGSKGNFFSAPDSDFQSGTYHINPPFIDAVFQKTADRVHHLLNLAYQNKSKLTFIYVMPDWKDFMTYNEISTSRYRKAYIYIPAGQGNYYQYRTDTYIPASFGTHIFVLSTENGLPDISAEVKEKFKSNTI